MLNKILENNFIIQCQDIKQDKQKSIRYVSKAKSMARLKTKMKQVDEED